MKKKVLLVWWYDRRDLIAPYLKMRDEIEFTVLFYRFPEQENKEVAESLPFRRIYWMDYLSPYAMIKDVQPEKILFFGHDSTLTIALIAAANVLKVPTAYVSHGLRSDFTHMLESQQKKQIENEIERYSDKNPAYQKKKWHTLLFLLNVISFRNLKTIQMVLGWIYTDFKIKNKLLKLKSFQNPLRKVRSYYLYAQQNASLIKGTDMTLDSQIYYTGPYSMDDIFSKISKSHYVEPEQKYWLFIDQPIQIIKREDRLRLFKKISLAAKAQNKQLLVKLHPMEYELESPLLENIRWERTVDNIEELIVNSEGCFGFYSTLMLAIIPFKKTIVFDIDNSYFTNEWAKMKVVKKLNFYNFKEEGLNFDNFEVSKEHMQKFIDKHITYTDGKCTERLKREILS